MVFLTTIAAAIWLALPGFLLAMREQRSIAFHAAAAVASITTMSLFAALLSTLLPQGANAWLPLATTVPFVIFSFFYQKTSVLVLPELEWQAFAPPLFAIAIAVCTYRLGYAPQPDGSLVVHSWYNADWFKHLGHTNAVANLGLPAKDIFAAGEPLHYYWLFYVMPGAAGALNGDPAGSLYWSNHFVTALFWLLIYGLVRRAGASPLQAALLGSAACILFAAQGTVNWLRSGLSMEAFAAQFQPTGPVLISMGLYIPQHTMMLSILMAWAVICYLERDKPVWPLRILVLAALSSAGAVSTLFGALCLIIYGLAQLALCNRKNWTGCFAEIGTVGLAAMIVVFALQVLDPSIGSNAISSPLFVEPPTSLPYHLRLFVTTVGALTTLGPAFLLGIAMLLRWNRADDSERDPLLILAAIALAIGLAGTILPEGTMENLRLAREIRLRAAYPAALGALLGLGWMVAQSQNARFRPAMVWGLIICCLMLAIPSAVLRIIWHGTKGPEFYTYIPADDIRILNRLAVASSANDIVWQYPEVPELAGGGDDTWVPIFSGRQIPASLRATDYPEAAPKIEAAERFFSGEDEAIPNNVKWVYLSRALHAASYDGLVKRLSSNTEFSRDYCLDKACLFRRGDTTLNE